MHETWQDNSQPTVGRRSNMPNNRNNYKNTRNQYASPPEGNAIPAGHVQQRLALNLVSLRDS